MRGHRLGSSKSNCHHAAKALLRRSKRSVCSKVMLEETAATPRDAKRRSVRVFVHDKIEDQYQVCLGIGLSKRSELGHLLWTGPIVERQPRKVKGSERRCGVQRTERRERAGGNEELFRSD